LIPASGTYYLENCDEKCISHMVVENKEKYYSRFSPPRGRGPDENATKNFVPYLVL
jgi:hypothetical protein